MVRYLEVRDVPLAQLQLYPGNPRLHDEDALDESVQANGQYRAVVARRLPDGTLQLLAGHGTRNATWVLDLLDPDRAAGPVLDVFAGAGSTLLACESTGHRSARVIELDPGYCDVICRRWQDATGETPVHAETGRPVNFPSP